MKKSLLMVLSVMVLSITLIILTSHNSVAFRYGDFEVNNGVLIGYYGPGGDVIIPNDLGITSIDRTVFSYNHEITSINIPDSVVEIKDLAFVECVSLKTIKLPKEITQINSHTFRGCISLTEIQIPQNVTYIGDAAFLGCSALTEIDLPENLEQIRPLAFDSCSNLALVRFYGNAPAFDERATAGLNPFSYCDPNLTMYYIEGKTGFTDPWYGYHTVALNPDVLPIINEPVFSKASGFYDETLYISISSNDNEAIIRYTTDGSDPDEKSQRYFGPIKISKTTILKAKAFTTKGESQVAFSHYTIVEIPLITKGLKITYTGFDRIELQWDSLKYATDYKIYRNTNGTSLYVPIKIVQGLSFLDIGLQPNTTYKYKILSSNPLGDGLFSSIITATTENTPNIFSPEWPVSKDFTRITSMFGNRFIPEVNKKEFHYGIDIGNASDVLKIDGAIVRAADNGTVTYKNIKIGCGRMVIISHANGYMTRYLHLASYEDGIKDALKYNEGEEVIKGQIIGKVGGSNYTQEKGLVDNAFGPHLHFDIWENNKRIDPLKLLNGIVSFDRIRQSYEDGIHYDYIGNVQFE